MRRFSLYTAICVTVLTFLAPITGCSDSSTEPTTRDLIGSFTTTFDFIPIEFTDEGEIAVAQTPIQATGSFDEFGNVNATLDQIVNFTVIPTEMTSTAVYTMENGDELWTEAVAHSSFPDSENNITFSGTHTITGGTGRFENATGEADVTGGANLNNMTGYFQLEGSITY